MQPLLIESNFLPKVYPKGKTMSDWTVALKIQTHMSHYCCAHIKVNIVRGGYLSIIARGCLCGVFSGGVYAVCYVAYASFEVNAKE